MISDVISGFAREYIQNGSYLPKVAKGAVSITFALCCIFYSGPVADGVTQAGMEKAQQMMKLFQPMIDNISERAVPDPVPAP